LITYAVYPSFPDTQVSSFSVYGNEVSSDIKPAMILLAHLVVTSSELPEVNESAVNQINAGVTPPH
jgi:hypothetical protein